MSSKQKIQREDVASDKLTDYVAQKNIEEDLVGEAREATILDVRTEFEEHDNMLVEFEIKLPDQSTGYLRFSEYYDELLQDFLEDNLHTTHSEMNTIMKSFPVVKTDTGWCAKIGDAPLKYVFEEGNSSWLFNISSIGVVEPNEIIKYSILILSILPIIQLGFLWVIMMPLLYFGFVLFAYVPSAVLLSPMSRDIHKKPVGE